LAPTSIHGRLRGDSEKREEGKMREGEQAV